MSNPMFPEKWESSSKSSRRLLKRRERKMWKKPIKISRFPSFGFSGSDFTIDQIPTIFSGYTAESEDSSSSEMSDDSRTYSKSSDENEELDQERSRSVRRRPSVSRISSMKVFRRQSTRKLYGGGQRLKKMRSMKRLTSNSRNIMRKKNLDTISREDLELLQPHYLRPTSSSASKNVEKIQKNLGEARLKRIASLRYNGLLKATCSSAMKGSSSKKSNDVCTYRYCSLHGRRHSHAADNNNVSVPSLKRFVSMRRNFLKRQKSVNRRLVLLKRTLSRKRGPLGGHIVTDQESKQVDGESDQEVSSSENCGNDSESNGGSSGTLMADVDDKAGGESDQEVSENGGNGSELIGGSNETVMVDVVDNAANQEVFEEEASTSENCENDSESNGRSIEMVMVDVDDNGDSMETIASAKEYKLETMDDSDGITDKDMEKNDICEQTVTGLDLDAGKVEGTKSEETVGNNEEDGKNTENVWNDTVALVKQAFDEILGEITDDDTSDDVSITKEDTLEGELAIEDDVGADSSDSDMKPIKGRDKHLSVIVSTSHKGKEYQILQRGPKKWSYLKRVILLKRFLKSVDRRERRKLSDGKESEAIMRLRRELVGEKKNAEEWMLDHALRQVISTLAPSQKKKVKHLVKAFESLIPMDGGFRGHDDLGSPGGEENKSVNLQTVLRNNKDSSDLEEITSEASSSLSIGVKPDGALESIADASLCNHLAVEEEVHGLALGSSIEEEEEENKIENLETVLRNNKDTTDLLEVLPGKEDLEETKLSSEASSFVPIGMKPDEALELKADASLCHHPAVEEEVLASGPSIEEEEEEEEEKTGDSEKQNLSTWRNLIQKHNSERKNDETEQEHKWSYGTDQMTGIEEDGDAAAIRSFQEAFETILSEISDPSFDEEIVSESSNSLKEKKEEDQGDTKRSWNSLRKVILLKRFVKSLEKVRVINPRKLWNTPVESAIEGESVFLRHSILERRRTDGEELMLDYALRQAISRLAPIQRKKVELLVQAFDTVLDGHDTPIQTKTSVAPLNNNETGEDCEVKKDEQMFKSVFSRLQVHQKELKREEEVDSTPKESRNLPPIRNVKQRIVVEKEKDSRLWKLIYKHMVTEKEGTDFANGESVASVEGKFDDEADGLQIDARRSGTVTLVREALEKILSEIPDNSSDDQSMHSDTTTDQELFERSSQGSEEHVSSSREITFKPKSNEKRVKGWNNVKKVILLRRFVSDLGSLTRLSPKTPRVLPWEPDPETEKIRLRHQEIGGKRNSEEWMLDYALRQAISTLAPSQKRKVSLLAQAFDTISLQDMGSGSTPGSAATSRNISRQSSISSAAVHAEIEANAEIIRGKLRNLQEDLKESTKVDGVANNLEEKQQCSSLWRLLCKQMEDNEINQTLPEETRKEAEEQEEEESKEDTNVDGEKMELYKTEAVELLGEVIDEISIEESQNQNHIQETLQVPKVRINRWGNLKKVILLRRFVKALENVRKFNPREPRFLPPKPDVEAEKVNLRHQETQNKRNGDEWMADNALQEVVSKLTPARKLKVQLLVQAFETLSATGN